MSTTLMTLLEQVQQDIVSAMKAKDELKLSTARMIKTALKKVEVDSMKPLDDASGQQVLRSLVKQHTDSAEMFRKGGRLDLAEKEESERVIIESYLPAAATPAELGSAISSAISETGATTSKQMGLVMKAAQAKLAGKNVDSRQLSEMVKARLA
jgi:uncharacterized protein YqeY